MLVHSVFHVFILQVFAEWHYVSGLLPVLTNQLQMPSISRSWEGWSVVYVPRTDNRRTKTKNKKQKRTAHRAGPSIGGWNFSGLWCHDGSHNPGLQLQLRGRMETRTPGLSLHSTVNVKLIKSFPKNGCTEPKFPISISEKWESCLRSQTLRADIAHFLCKKPPASSGSVEASAWVRLVVDESKHCLLRSPGSWTKGSEEQVASWGQDCCVLSLL